jgi:anti-sigma B factor antagonist
VKISVNKPREHINHVVLDGRMDVAGTQEVEAAFNAIVAGSPNVIVDLGKVSYICSLGMRMLVAGAKSQARIGGKMVLANPDELTRKILMTTGIDHLIPIFNRPDEALFSRFEQLTK